MKFYDQFRAELSAWDSEQLMRIMKLTIIIFIACLLQVSATTKAQKISLNEKNASLETIIRKIRSQTSYFFIGNTKLIRKANPIDIDVKNVSIEEALNLCFSNQPLIYSIIDKTVVIKRKALLFSPEIIEQKIRVKGKVTDETGSVLPGASVKIYGSEIVVTTNSNGEFELEVPDQEAVLLVSYVGYEVARIKVQEGVFLNVSLKPQQRDLTEVVVVGYGTQKKVNLTGAISTISGNELNIKPVGQTSAALQGVASGVTVTQSTGRPGGDAAKIRIRGVGTLNNSDPLVLIDGIEGSMNNIDPNLIESISVLKDAASASIYGSRAANGVILVTTKRGSTKIGINYNNYIGWQTPTDMPDVVNALDHMLLMNEAYTNLGRTPLYSAALIEQYQAQGGINSDKYPNTDWQKEVLTGSGLQQSHFLTINGGSDKVRMLASAGYFDQKGIIENSDFKRITIRNNADITFSSKLSAKFDLQFVNAVTTEPGMGTSNIFNYMDGIPANQIGINSNGTWGVGWNGLNPIAASREGGTNRTKAPFGSINATINYHPVEWLSAEFTIAPKYAESNSKNFNKSIQTYLPDGTASYKIPALTSLSEGSNRSLYNNFRATLTFDKTFGNHNIKALLGASQEDYHNDVIGAYRDTYILPDYPVINAGSALNQQASGTSQEWALRSFFGRINYDYEQKYLFEVNGRYDGSSRFAKGNKYAFFPSASAGWRISQEDFMQPLKHVINELKIRASWGRLGNQNIGTYPASSSVDLGSSALGKQIVNIAALNNLANSDIVWETTEMSDIGIDMTLFSNLTVTADYYIRKTKDILILLDIPLIMGLGAPFQNAGLVNNKGWELGIGYKGNLSEFKYSVNFNLSDVKNKVIDLHGINKTDLLVSREGYPFESIYGLQAEGFFKDAADVAGHAKQSGAIGPGDLKYKDQNGDGIINDNDRVILGSTIPRYTFGTNLSGSFKGFDFTVFLQGVGKANGYLRGPGIMPFSVGNLGGTILETNKDRWTPENPNAKYPRLAFGEANNEQSSSFWMKDAAYLRMKDIQFGYTLPTTVVNKIGVKNLRLFVNGSNLFSADNFWDGFDVESPVGPVNVYPQVKVYSFGLNANF